LSENLIKTIWWLSVTYIAWGNHLGSLSYWQLVSMSCGMQLCHLVLHPPWSIDHLPNIEIHCLSEHIGGVYNDPRWFPQAMDVTESHHIVLIKFSDLNRTTSTFVWNWVHFKQQHSMFVHYINKNWSNFYLQAFMI
jgi:hypothetical protein